MSVVIRAVSKGSAGDRKGIRPGDTLVSLNGHEIFDVLDYRYYADAEDLQVKILNHHGRQKTIRFRRIDGVDDLGLEFESYLMDRKQCCRNKCIFCFVDQMPPGMRESLYFKDDDSRLSFFFGNYITLTAITEREVRRIIDMHISPINISVHTMDPALRVRMMGNPHAGEALSIIDRLSDAGISMNTQLVLCPGINDGEALRYSLDELSKRYPAVQSIAAVPVGLTSHREGLPHLDPYDAESAAQTLDIIEEFNSHFRYYHGFNLCCPADEFFIKAQRALPPAEYYGEISQLENGVGLCALLRQSFTDALEALPETTVCPADRCVRIATGEAAYPLLRDLVDLFHQRFPDSDVSVIKIINRFFGESVTVAGLITGKDLIEQAKSQVPPGATLLLSSSIIKQDEEVLLDDVTSAQLEDALGARVVFCGETDGDALLNYILGE